MEKLVLPYEAQRLLTNAPSIVAPETIQEMIDLSCGGEKNDYFEVKYEVPGDGWKIDSTVARVRNGISVNYTDPYMRRRDPDCLVVADDYPTDKTRFSDIYKKDFAGLRNATFEWLGKQDLVYFNFIAGQKGMGINAMVIAPVNASYFALSLAMLQGFIPPSELTEDFKPQAIIYVAPVFRYTEFDGRQVVVHNRRKEVYELFSYNLYPGPSAKKGVYGMLLDLGEHEGWTTVHCSAVQVVTPYDNVFTIMHEGASGGGKSEMLEQTHRAPDGRVLLGQNLVSDEVRYLMIPRSCELKPVADDMALCHPNIQNGNGKLSITDAEEGWFVRVNHINDYGVDPHLEAMTAIPKSPLVFLNIDAVPGSTALLWEHTMDEPGKPCPNPRVIIPRNNVPDIVTKPVRVDIRSFGVRTPPCTKENPTYGIIGLFHLLPPSLAWLWRLVSPRGYNNPSILDDQGMSSEGVGSYWPFASGQMVTQANILLEQFIKYKRMQYILTPNQHIGAWKVGFFPQWLAREYLARRGTARFHPSHIRPARSPLLGYAMHQIHVEGQQIARWFLQVDTQPEVGPEAYDQGAMMLRDFFHKYLKEFLRDNLSLLGKQIITCCLDDGTLEDYEMLIPTE